MPYMTVFGAYLVFVIFRKLGKCLSLAQFTKDVKIMDLIFC